MRCGTRHKELDENGEGKCSVPMWCSEIPAGFCNEVAYGRPLLGRDEIGGIDIYVPALACHTHGGPKERVSDG